MEDEADEVKYSKSTEAQQWWISDGSLLLTRFCFAPASPLLCHGPDNMSARCAHYVRRHFPPPSREKPAEEQVSIIHVRDEHEVPFLSSLPHTGLMDTPITPPKRRRLFWTRRDSQMHLCNPPKTQVCILGKIKPPRTGAVQCWSSLLCDKMKETNNISHRAAIMGTVK